MVFKDTWWSSKDFMNAVQGVRMPENVLEHIPTGLNRVERDLACRHYKNFCR
jgi:hypothetical protein